MITGAGEHYKRPESILVVVYTETGKVLLLRRADHEDFWQSVTGSMGWDETDPRQTAIRELKEETGIDAGDALVDLNLSHQYEIFPQWRHRYAPGTTENTEHAFALKLSGVVDVCLNPDEHVESVWLSFADVDDKIRSWTNRKVIDHLKQISRN